MAVARAGAAAKKPRGASVLSLAKAEATRAALERAAALACARTLELGGPPGLHQEEHENGDRGESGAGEDQGALDGVVHGLLISSLCARAGQHLSGAGGNRPE